MNRFKIANFLLTLSLVIGAISCVSTDDITKTIPDPKVSPTTNPLASLSPSSSFNWEMYNHQNATIAIADRYDSQYDYVLQIFDEQPISGISPIGVGTARGNSPLAIPLDINQRGTLLYVRQIDPAGRVETYSFEKPVTDSFTLSLFSTDSETKAVTRAVATSSTFLETPSKPESLVSATTYPVTASVDFPDSQWTYDGDYVIKEGETKLFAGDFSIDSKENGANIYVAGTLEYGSLLTLNNANIYVLPTGKIKGDSIRIHNSCSLYIAKGATAEMGNVNVYSKAQLIVDGTLNANNINGAGNTGLFYVGASGVVNVTNDVWNHFSSVYLDANQTEGTGATLTCANVIIKNTEASFVVKNLAQFKVSGTFTNHSNLYNEGLVSATNYDGGKAASVYNSCAMIISNELNGLKALYMKNASVSGPWDTENEELTAIPSATLNGSIYLYDGSYLYINNLIQNQITIQGLQTDDTKEASLFRVDECRIVTNIDYASTVLGIVKLWIPEQYQVSYKITDGASAVTDALDIPYDLETCSGLVVAVIPAEPSEPELINGSLKGHYTINFEDKWPQYGDYDLNDLVYHVDSVKTVQTTDGIINELRVNMQLLAVGATYHLGFGLQMSSLKSSDIQDITVSSLGQVGATSDELGAMELDGAKQIEKAGATDPVVIPLFYDAHAFLTGVASSTSNPRTMLGTGGNRTTLSPRAITLHITFSASAQIDASKLTLSDFDFFLYRTGDDYAADGRVEVHLRDYLPTKKASQAYFGTSNDASVVASGQTYRSSDNFPWAIRVMDNTEEITLDEEVTAVQVPWYWVIEGKSINVAYPGFAAWVNSGSDSDAAWSVAE